MRETRYLVESTGDGRWRVSVVQGGVIKRTEAEARQYAMDMAQWNHSTPLFGRWEKEAGW